MQLTYDAPLAQYSSFAVGGPAQQLYTCTDTAQLVDFLGQHDSINPLWLLGYGTNVLISDMGLPGDTLLIRSRNIELPETHLLVADAGVWWDDAVLHALQNGLWGLELMSGIPGSVGAAVVGNIAAYGQAVAKTLAWVEVFDLENHEVRRLIPDELGLSYRYSRFQAPEFKNLIILRAAFTLASQAKQQLEYQSALDIAAVHSYNLTTLDGCRQTILQTRESAGSLWDYRAPQTQMHTAGSFFRNPMVSEQTAERLLAFDETGKTAETIKKMNLIHGGEQMRVSAAHVLLAAGFSRGQTWGTVRLHPDHILKIENTGGATAQAIYNVAQEIIATVKDKLDIDLTPEVRFLGTFIRE